MLHNTIEIFCSCAPEDQKYLEQLKIHLVLLERQHLVRLWEKSQVLPGTEWETEYNKHLNSAQILLFLISPSFLSSSFCYYAIDQALRLANQKKIVVLPVLLHPTSLQGTFLERLQYLPHDGRPIVQQRNRDEAFVEVADAIKKLIWSYFLENKVPLTQHRVSPGSKLSEKLTEQTAFDFMAAVVDPKLAQFHARAQHHKRVWERFRSITLGSTGLACLFALTDLLSWGLSTSQLWQAILKLLLVLAASVSLICVLTFFFARLYSFQRWQHYLQRRTDLHNEKRMYETGRGIYALAADSQRFFMERVFQIIQNSGEGTISEDETRDYLPSEKNVK